MAPFVNLDVSYDIEKEPSFLGYSKGVDVPSSLAQGDTSLGRLFGNIGDTVDAFAKGAYANITDRIKTEARADLEPVINEMGGNLTPSEAPIVAGTGARGARYAAAAGVTGLGTGTEDLGASPAKLPSDFQANVDRVKQLKAAFDAGALSDTRYKTEAATIFQKLRARYGVAWSDEIDSAIREVNNTPANDVRKAVLNDLISASAAGQSTANKLLSLYEQNGKYLPIIEPGLTFDKFASNPHFYLKEINGLKAQDYALDRQKATLALQTDKDNASSKTAYGAFQTEANMHVSNIIRRTMGSFQARGLQLLSQGANVNTQQLEEFASQGKALYAAVSNQIDEMGRAPLTYKEFDYNIGYIPSDVTYAKYLKANELKEIKEAALAPMSTILDAVGVKDFTAATAAAELAKWQGNADFLKLTKDFPALRAYPAMRKLLGDQVMQTVIEMDKGAVFEPLTKAVTTAGYFNIADTDSGAPAPPASSVIGAATESNPQNPGKVSRTVLAGIKEMAAHDNPDIGARAVESIYGDAKLWASTPSDQKTKIYTFLGSNDFTTKMLKLKETHPEAWNTYSTWMERNFRSVYLNEVSDAASAIGFEKYNWGMDPKTLRVTAESKVGGIFPDQAQSYVEGLNSVSSLIAPILKEKYGELAPIKFLEALGINPNAPKQPGFLDSITGKKMGETDPVQKFLKSLLPAETPVEATPTGPRTEAPPTGAPSEKPTLTANAAHTSELWGNPLQKGFKSQYLTDIATPSGKKIQVNKVAAEAFQGFLADLEATGYKINDIGGYSLRTNKSDPGRLSQHAWGNAIDINPSRNAFGSRKNDMPANVNELAKKWGLVWGGNWRHPDPMHFEYAGTKDTRRADIENPQYPAG